MTWEIHTFGGGELLWKVLNGLSLLLKSESDTFTPLLHLTASLGVLWAGARAALQHQGGVFAKDYFIPVFLILNLFFVPKCTVWIKDEGGSSQHVSKIDHIPAGLGLIASLASQISYELTKALEEKLAPAELPQKLYYTKAGPMFAAHLLARAKDFQVVDPMALQNLKDFMRQCYTLPYLYTNIDPGRKAALESRDILEFLRQNPHPALGLYWRGEGGRAAFLSCKACLPKVEALLKAQEPKSLITALWGLFEGKKDVSSSQDVSSLSRKLKTYLEGGWRWIAKDSEEVHALVGQQMLINAYREALDDDLEKHGHPRAHPRLVSYSATRSAAQENMNALVKGALAGRYLISLQTTIFSILLLSFFFVIPLSLLPGGLGLLGTWVKLIFWVQSWPIFFTLLNSLGLMWLEQETRGIFMSLGNGLTVLTQNGLSDAAFDSYCLVQGLFWSVPLLTWAILSKGGMALVSMAERFAPSAPSMAGAAMVDNTQSFDVQSFHTRSMGSYQMAQQHLSPSFSTGGVLDDGRFRRETSVSGESTFTEKLSTLKNTLSLSEGIEGHLSDVLSRENQVMQGYQGALNTAHTELSSRSADLTEAIGTGKVFSKSFSEAQNRAVQETLEKAMSFDRSVTHQKALSDSSSWTHSARAGVSLTPQNWLGKSLQRIGLSLEAGLTTGGSWSAEDRALYEHLKRSGVTDRDLISTSTLYSAVENTQASFTDESTKRLAEAYRGSLDTVKSLSDSIQASQSRIDRLSASTQVVRREGLSFASNINDDALTYSAQKRFSGDRERAAHWQSTQSDEFMKDARDYTAGFGERIARYRGTPDQESLAQIYKEYQESLLSASPGQGSIERVKAQARTGTLGEGHHNKIEAQTEALHTFVQGHVHSPDLPQRGHALEESQPHIQAEREKVPQKAQEERARNLILRAMRKE